MLKLQAVYTAEIEIDFDIITNTNAEFLKSLRSMNEPLSVQWVTLRLTVTQLRLSKLSPLGND